MNSLVYSLIIIFISSFVLYYYFILYYDYYYSFLYFLVKRRYFIWVIVKQIRQIIDEMKLPQKLLTAGHSSLKIYPECLFLSGIC